MTKKYRVTKRVYNKFEDTYWEEFEMTQDRWDGLYSYAKEYSAESVEHLSEKMTEKLEDWELLYSLLSNGDFENCDPKTWQGQEHDEEQIFIEELEVKTKQIKEEEDLPILGGVDDKEE